MLQKAWPMQCLDLCVFVKMFDFKSKMCVNDSNSEAPGFPLFDRYY